MGGGGGEGLLMGGSVRRVLRLLRENQGVPDGEGEDKSYRALPLGRDPPSLELAGWESPDQRLLVASSLIHSSLCAGKRYFPFVLCC